MRFFYPVTCALIVGGCFSSTAGSGSCNLDLGDGGAAYPSGNIPPSPDSSPGGCASALDCQDGEVCCATMLFPFATGQCQTTACAPGHQPCATSAECPSGQTCASTEVEGVSLMACLAPGDVDAGDEDASLDASPDEAEAALSLDGADATGSLDATDATESLYANDATSDSSLSLSMDALADAGVP